MSQSIEDFKKQIGDRVATGISNNEIKYINETPETKSTGIRIVRRRADNIKTLFAVGFMVIVICASILTYLAYNNKLNLVNLVCPAPAEVKIPECPASPSCPSLTCPDVYLNSTCSPNIKIYTNST